MTEILESKIEFSDELEAFLARDEHSLVIDATDLDKELTLQAARYVFYAEKAILAEREYDLLKQKLGHIKAEVEKKIRQKYLESGAKAPTIAVVEAEVSTNPGVLAIENQLINLKGKRDVAKSIKEGLHMRKDLLIQIAIAKRSEMESIRSSTVKAVGM